MKRVFYFLGKFRNAASRCFAPYRIKRYGLRLALLNFVIFLFRRSGSFAERALIRRKDKIVQAYLYGHYGDVIEKYRDNP